MTNTTMETTTNTPTTEAPGTRWTKRGKGVRLGHLLNYFPDMDRTKIDLQDRNRRTDLAFTGAPIDAPDRERIERAVQNALGCSPRTLLAEATPATPAELRQYLAAWIMAAKFEGRAGSPGWRELIQASEQLLGRA